MADVVTAEKSVEFFNRSEAATANFRRVLNTPGGQFSNGDERAKYDRYLSKLDATLTDRAGDFDKKIRKISEELAKPGFNDDALRGRVKEALESAAKLSEKYNAYYAVSNLLEKKSTGPGAIKAVERIGRDQPLFAGVIFASEGDRKRFEDLVASVRDKDLAKLHSDANKGLDKAIDKIVSTPETRTNDAKKDFDDGVLKGAKALGQDIIFHRPLFKAAAAAPAVAAVPVNRPVTESAALGPIGGGVKTEFQTAKEAIKHIQITLQNSPYVEVNDVGSDNTGGVINDVTRTAYGKYLHDLASGKTAAKDVEASIKDAVEYLKTNSKANFEKLTTPVVTTTAPAATAAPASPAAPPAPATPAAAEVKAVVFKDDAEAITALQEIFSEMEVKGQKAYTGAIDGKPNDAFKKVLHDYMERLQIKFGVDKKEGVFDTTTGEAITRNKDNAEFAPAVKMLDALAYLSKSPNYKDILLTTTKEELDKDHGDGVSKKIEPKNPVDAVVLAKATTYGAALHALLEDNADYDGVVGPFLEKNYGVKLDAAFDPKNAEQMKSVIQVGALYNEFKGDAVKMQAFLEEGRKEGTPESKKLHEVNTEVDKMLTEQTKQEPMTQVTEPVVTDGIPPRYVEAGFWSGGMIAMGGLATTGLVGGLVLLRRNKDNSIDTSDLTLAEKRKIRSEVAQELIEKRDGLKEAKRELADMNDLKKGQEGPVTKDVAEAQAEIAKAEAKLKKEIQDSIRAKEEALTIEKAQKKAQVAKQMKPYREAVAEAELRLQKLQGNSLTKETPEILAARAEVAALRSEMELREEALLKLKTPDEIVAGRVAAEKAEAHAKLVAEVEAHADFDAPKSEIEQLKAKIAHESGIDPTKDNGDGVYRTAEGHEEYLRNLNQELADKQAALKSDIEARINVRELEIAVAAAADAPEIKPSEHALVDSNRHPIEVGDTVHVGPEHGGSGGHKVEAIINASETGGKGRGIKVKATNGNIVTLYENDLLEGRGRLVSSEAASRPVVDVAAATPVAVATEVVAEGEVHSGEGTTEGGGEARKPPERLTKSHEAAEVRLSNSQGRLQSIKDQIEIARQSGNAKEVARLTAKVQSATEQVHRDQRVVEKQLAKEAVSIEPPKPKPVVAETPHSTTPHETTPHAARGTAEVSHGLLRGAGVGLGLYGLHQRFLTEGGRADFKHTDTAVLTTIGGTADLTNVVYDGVATGKFITTTARTLKAIDTSVIIAEDISRLAKTAKILGALSKGAQIGAASTGGVNIFADVAVVSLQAVSSGVDLAIAHRTGDARRAAGATGGLAGALTGMAAGAGVGFVAGLPAFGIGAVPGAIIGGASGLVLGLTGAHYGAKAGETYLTTTFESILGVDDKLGAAIKNGLNGLGTKAVDANGDNKLTVKEVKAALEKRGIGSIRQLDRDGDGNVSKTELEFGLSIRAKIEEGLNHGLTKQFMQAMKLDANGNGKIDNRQEMDAAVTRISTALDNLGVKSLDQMDANHDGTVTAAELEKTLVEAAHKKGLDGVARPTPEFSVLAGNHGSEGPKGLLEAQMAIHKPPTSKV